MPLKSLRYIPGHKASRERIHNECKKFIYDFDCDQCRHAVFNKDIGRFQCLIACMGGHTVQFGAGSKSRNISCRYYQMRTPEP